jgi:hypothetical protein
MQSNTPAAKQRVTMLRKVDIFLVMDESPSLPGVGVVAPTRDIR